MSDTAYDKNGETATGSGAASAGGAEIIADANAIERAKKDAIDPLGGLSEDYIARRVMDRNQDSLLIVTPNQDDGPPYVLISNPHGIWRIGIDRFYHYVRSVVKSLIEEDIALPPDKVSADQILKKRRTLLRFLSENGAERVRAVIPGVYDSEHVVVEANGGIGRYPHISVCEAKDLDAKQRYLGTPNGIVDLHNPTLRLDPRTREAQGALVTKMTAVPFNPTLKGISPEAIADVDSILAHLTEADQKWAWDSMAWELRGAGGRVYFWIGPTGTGKSTFNRGLTACLGDYGTSVPSTVFLPSGHKQNTDDATANAIGNRIGRTDEMPPVVTLAMIEAMKAWSGRESKRARASYRRNGKEGYLPCLVASVNNPPDLYGDDPWFRGSAGMDESSIDRRLCMLNFPPRDGGTDELLADRVAEDPERQTVFLARLLTRIGEIEEPPPMSDGQMQFIHDMRDKKAGGSIKWIDKHIRRDEKTRLGAKAVWNRAVDTAGFDDDAADKKTVFGVTQRGLTIMVTKYLRVDAGRGSTPEGVGTLWEGLRLATDEEIKESEAR